MRNPFAHLRVLNPTTTQWALITAGTVVGITLIATTAYASSKKSKGKGSDLPSVGPGEPICDPAPYEIDPEALRMLVESKVDAGLHDKQRIAIDVAMQLYGAHPSGVSVDFPPSGDPLPGVGCVWDWTIWTVDRVFADRGITDEPTVEPSTGSLEWVSRTSNDPGYPWEEPVLHVHNWPSPGMFVDIGNSSGDWKPSNGYDSMVKAYLGAALAMAGADVSLAESHAGQELRKQARTAIMFVGGYNDRNFGQTNLNYAGGNDPNQPGGDTNKGIMGAYVMNEQGRGLNWLPHHKDLKAEIQDGEAMQRGSSLSGRRLLGLRAGYRHMLVWLPALDLDALRLPVPKVSFLQWSDGSSTLYPPPQIQALGYNSNGVSLPGVSNKEGVPAPPQGLHIPFSPA